MVRQLGLKTDAYVVLVTCVLVLSASGCERNNAKPVSEKRPTSSLGDSSPKEHDFPALDRLAASLTKEGKPREAIVILKKVLDIAPGYFSAWNNLGNAYSATGEINRAVSAYRKAIASLPSFTAAYMNLADVLHAAKRYEDVQEVYENLKQINPGYPLVYYLSGWNYLDLGMYEKALYASRTYTEMLPSDVRGWVLQGLAHTKLERYKEAGQAYQTALSLKSEYPRALNGMGVLLQQQGKPDEAIQYYLRARKSAPQDREWLWNLNRVAMQYGRMERLIEELDAAIDRAELPDEARFFRARAYNFVGQYNNAIRDCTDGLNRSDPDWHADFYQMRGISYMLKGDSAKAQTDLSKVMELTEDLAYPALWIWSCHMRDGDKHLAHTVIQEARSKPRLGLFTFRLLGYYLGDVGQDMLLAAASEGNHLCEAYYYIGEKNAVEGKLGDAAKWLQKSLDTQLSDNYEYMLAHRRLETLPHPVALGK